MKEITRKSLDELAATMSVIEKTEQESYNGMYWGDCFWRCVSHLKNNDNSEAAAAAYALSYIANEKYADDPLPTVMANGYLMMLGAGMTLANARTYVQADSTLINKIVYFIPNQISSYSSTELGTSNTAHFAIVINGSTIYDPQLGASFSVTPAECEKFTRLN